MTAGDTCPVCGSIIGGGCPQSTTQERKDYEEFIEQQEEQYQFKKMEKRPK